jgi:protein-S-isoprenylcysteine O-methyltransferase Ste14
MTGIDGIKGKNGEHPYGDAGQLILLGLFLIVWLGDSFVLRLSTVPADYLPRFIRLTFLVSCLGLAAVLFKSGHAVVSHARPASDLVSTGAFRYVRHPLYLGCILFYLGLAFCTFSLFSLVLWVAIFIFYNYIASYEEKLLEAKFGESYRIYQEHTGKWMPRMPLIRKDKNAVF